MFIPSTVLQFAPLAFSCSSGEFGVPESLNQQIEQLEAIYKSERDPKGRAFVPLADAHRRRGDLDKALAVLQEGLGAHPDFASGHMVAGWVYRAQRAPDKAMRSFKLVLTLDEENSLARAAIAELIDDQRAQDYRDKVAAQKAAGGSAGAAAEDQRPLVRIDSLAPEVLAQSDGALEADPDRVVRPIVSVASLAPGSAPETHAAPARAPDDSVRGSERPLLSIGSLAPHAESAAIVSPGARPGAVQDRDEGPALPINSLAPELPPENEPADDGSPVAPASVGQDVPPVPVASLAPDDIAVDRGVVSASDGDDRSAAPIATFAPEDVSEDVPVDDGPPVDDGIPRTPPPSLVLDHAHERMFGIEPIGEEIHTRTLAELYAAQGATERAIDTYRKMLDHDPANETFVRRLAELEAARSVSGAADVVAYAVPIESLAPDADPEDVQSGSRFRWLDEL